MRFGSPRLPSGTVLALLSLLLLVVAACSPADTGGNGAAGDGDGGEAGAGTAAVENGAVQISANQLEFDVSTIQAPAGEPFTIEFTNMEAVPHNVVVFTEQGGEHLSEGDEPVSGPNATAEYQVPALEPGEYYFECTIHPEMNGTVVVEG